MPSAEGGTGGLLRVEELRQLLTLAEGSARVPSPLSLAAGERALAAVARSQCLETRAEPAYWAAGTAGVAVPLGHLRIDAGRFGGHYVALLERPAMLDVGVSTITDRRVVFQGTWLRREWLFAQVTGVTHAVNEAWTIIETTDRDTALGFTYDDESPEVVRARLALAGALYDGHGAQVASTRGGA